ncbi:MAG: hypothetical protein NTY51_13505 [Deltaproteobacteria bacterium]|nr:hypothetical protein [Deltaproteobacteria bacterium]
MLFPYSDAAIGVPEPPGDFESNYRNLKKIINTAIKNGVALDQLNLIPKTPSEKPPKNLSRDDLLRLLKLIRRIKSRCESLLEPPVPAELERDILAKSPDDRLPWETEALEKIEAWKEALKTMRAEVRIELNQHLKLKFFQDKR